MTSGNENNASQAPNMKTQPTVESNASPAMPVNLITKEELDKKMRAGEAIQILNVLNPDQYVLGSIKGSKRIPLDKLDERINELNKSKLVITYCSSSDCNAAKSAAEKLVAKGFSVSAYAGGIKEWKEAGLPT